MNAHLPGTVSEGEEEEEGGKGKIPSIDQVQFLIKTAEEELGVKPLIGAGQFVSKETEEILRMGYLAQFSNLPSVGGAKKGKSHKRSLNDEILTLQSLSSDDVAAVAPTSVSTLSSDFTEPAQSEFSENTAHDLPGDFPQDPEPEKFELQIHGGNTDNHNQPGTEREEESHETKINENERTEKDLTNKEETGGSETESRTPNHTPTSSPEEDEERDTFEMELKERAWVKNSDGARRLREQRKSQLDELLAEAEHDFDQFLQEIDNISFSNRPSRGSIPHPAPPPPPEEKIELDFDFSSGDEGKTSMGGSESSIEREKGGGGVGGVKGKEETFNTSKDVGNGDRATEDSNSLTAGSSSQIKTISNISVYGVNEDTKWVEAKEREEKLKEEVKEEEEELNEEDEVFNNDGLDETDIIEVAYVSPLREESEERIPEGRGKEHNSEERAHSTTTTPEPASECTSRSKSPSPNLSHSPTPHDDDAHNGPLPLSFPNYCIVEETSLSSGGVVNEPISFCVDCTKAGRGRLEVIIEDERGENVEAEGSQIRSNVFEVCFVPLTVGKYSVSVIFGEKDIPSSPFICKVCDPSACITGGRGLALDAQQIGQEVTFQVDASKAGPGSLQVTFTGSNQPDDFKLLSSKDSLFTYSYIISRPGVYTLDITWAGHHIKGSPFNISLPEPAPFCPEACALLSRPNEKCRVGEEISISVDTSKSGYGELRAMLVSPTSEHACTVNQAGPVYTITAVPTGIGKHLLVLQYGGEEIPQSPILVHVSDPKLVKVDASSFEGKEVALNESLFVPVNTEAAGEGTLSVNIKTPNGSVDHGRVKRISTYQYTVSYTPKLEGSYSFEILYDWVSCLSSPLGFKAVKVWSIDDFTLIKPVPSRGSNYQLNTNIEFNVHTPGGEDSSLLQISALGTNDKSNKAHTSINSDGSGKYSLTMRATRNDDYKVSITYKGAHLKGSPFTVSVHSPTRSSKVAMFDPVIPLLCTQPLELVFDVTQAGYGKLSASAVNSKGHTMPLYVEQVNEEMYRVSFIPRASDTFMVTVLYADKHVNGSPFRVLYKEQATPPPVCVEFEPEMNARGLMGAAVYGRNIGRQEATVVQYERGKYQISFSPGKPDVFDLHVYWFDVEIPGSPFEVDLLGAENESSEALVDSVPYASGDGKVGLLSAAVSGKKTGAVPVHLTTSTPPSSSSAAPATSTPAKGPPNEESCCVEFNISSNDIYSVNLLWNGKPLQGMPVDIQL